MGIEITELDTEGLTVAVRHDEPLGNHTTFKIGGAVRAMYFPEDAAAAVRLCEVLCGHGVTPYILGNGSNILADDSDLDIIVINTKTLKNIEMTEAVNDNIGNDSGCVFITAGCGALLSEIAVFAQKNELTGFEFAHGIPGTLGGAVLMNAGAYGSEMKDIVRSTTAYNAVRGLYTITGDKHEFAYRESIFSQNYNMCCNDLILSSVIRLHKGKKADIDRRMEELAMRRCESQPLDKPSAGSTFKRPAEGYAAELIEQAGLKGYSIGGAQVSPKHSGFIVNNGGATYSDVMRLIEHVIRIVEKRTGISLEPEVKIWKS